MSKLKEMFAADTERIIASDAERRRLTAAVVKASTGIDFAAIPTKTAKVGARLAVPLDLGPRTEMPRSAETFAELVASPGEFFQFPRSCLCCGNTAAVGAKCRVCGN